MFFLMGVVGMKRGVVKRLIISQLFVDLLVIGR